MNENKKPRHSWRIEKREQLTTEGKLKGRCPVGVSAFSFRPQQCQGFRMSPSAGSALAGRNIFDFPKVFNTKNKWPDFAFKGGFPGLKNRAINPPETGF